MADSHLLKRFLPADGFGPARAWWNPRRKRFWLLLAILLYTLGGFLLAPWVIQTQVIPRVAAELGRPIQLDELRINPYVLSIDARGFSLTETDGAPLVGFDRLFVNFQLSSVFRLALTFREIRLERPSVEFTRDASGGTNFGRFLADIAAPEQAEMPPAEETGLVRLIVGELLVADGILELTDFVPQPEVSNTFGPINVTANDLSTLPATSGRQQVVIVTGQNGQVEWSGSLQLNPLLAEGRLEGGGPFLPIMYRYAEHLLEFEVSEGRAEFGFEYRVEITGDGELSAHVDGLDFGLRGIVMRTDEPEVEFLSLPDMSLSSGQFRWPEQTVRFAGLTISDAQLHVVREPDGLLNLQKLLMPGDELPAEADPDAPVVHPLQDWSVELGELEIVNFDVDFEDQSLATAAQPVSATVNALVRDISSSDGAQFPFESNVELYSGGSITLGGQFGVLPSPVVSSAMKIDQLALSIAQPWVTEAARVEIDAGLLNADTQITIDADEPLSLTGSLNIESFDISDVTKDERLVGWDRLAIDQFAANAANNSLELSELSIASPYVRILITADQTTNFEQLIVGAEASEAEGTEDGEAEEAGTAATPVVSVAKVIVAGGSADFTDLSLPLPFTAHIDDLQGQVSTLATDSTEPAKIELEGQVGEYGLTTVKGRILPNAPAELTDIQLEFRNLEMSELSPYTIKFAGRHIDDGKVDVNLEYLVEDGGMAGKNSIVMRDLTLGEKVDHPDAANLPLGLAVALLKGPDGTIDLDVPVSGDVNDPEFSVGGLVFKAFVNVITKVVTAPFRLLGGLVGVDADDFDQIEFRPGSADLAPPELEKLTKLAEALTLRPELGLQLHGAVDTDADKAALQAERVETMIEAELDATDDASTDEKMLLRRRQEVLETLVRRQLPDMDIEVVRQAWMHASDPAKPDGKQVLDEPAYMAALESSLVDAEPVSDQDLDGLATARADAIKESLLGDERLDAGRVMADTSRVAAELSESGWVPMKLELDAGAAASD